MMIQIYTSLIHSVGLWCVKVAYKRAPNSLAVIGTQMVHPRNLFHSGW